LVLVSLDLDQSDGRGRGRQIRERGWVDRIPPRGLVPLPPAYKEAIRVPFITAATGYEKLQVFP